MEPQITSSESNLSIQPKKNKKLKLFFITLVGLFIVLLILRPTLVIDAKTHIPISGATVKYKANDWNGCSDKSSHQTFTGVSFSILIFSPCQIIVSKDGYHVNGANRIKTLPGIFGFRIVRLNKITNPQENFVQFNRVFTEESSGMNVPLYLSNLQAGINPNQTKNDTDVDFKFTVIGNTEEAVNAVGRAVLEMEFFGNGGVQIISKDSTGSAANAEYYDMENLLEAPIDGYKKTIKIESGKSYVAKLRDGKHYMKFHVFGSKNYENNTSYACMTGYLQPLESRNLEFVNVYEHISCSNNSTGNDNSKQIYLNFQKEIAGRKSIVKVDFWNNLAKTVFFKENIKDYHFTLLPNNGRFSNSMSSISKSSIMTLEVDVDLPSFEVFEKTYFEGEEVPVDLFFNGKYIDPSKITND